MDTNVPALSILWMVYYLSVLRSVWAMRVIAMTLVIFEGWIGRLQFIFIYSTLFMRLFIFIVHDPLDVSEVCDNAGVEILWKGIVSA